MSRAASRSWFLRRSLRALTKHVLSFEEQIAACESHSAFRADIVVVYGRRLPVRDTSGRERLSPAALSETMVVKRNIRASRYLHVVRDGIPNLFLPHYLRKKR
ncbi:hypothetical protein EN41_17175 [Agrobacterium tumefaciens]|uniref:Uncharacterized protein n=1 Tax=Agrobacterium fabrum (strain C58 / ATCC 33970) TaxID=176299 RepID=A9CJH6_AGRFC|nr:hypothetical protein Atu1098 [Agrobacterium fabrum str. C58]KEY55496.1 hypothetical protein EN41_17175 [Agrobacterium tumefaciens]KJX88932.1 hypothetical protein SY94_1004 [Agrobacterium tumefaciens]QRM60644.1 hypothetical protein F3P66_08830 [Agrobacterium fabrum]TRB31947.1 hypothetical protein EXN51_01970 [Agrobacterium fabrum]